MPEMISVTSSNVRCVAYDDAVRELTVEFHAPDGAPPRLYVYSPIDREVFDALIDPANSAGKIVAALKRDPSIACRKVEVGG